MDLEYIKILADSTARLVYPDQIKGTRLQSGEFWEDGKGRYLIIFKNDLAKTITWNTGDELISALNNGS